MAVELDVGLRRHAGLHEGADVAALHDVDLRLHDIDAGDHLGHGVLDLDARVDLDEVEVAGVGIEEELDGSGGDVVRGTADAQRRLAQLCAGRLVEERGRRAFNDLLVAALDRAVALVEMDQRAVGVAEDLHFNVSGVDHQLLEIDLVLAEGGLGLALGRLDRLQEAVLVLDRPHAATAAAP